MTSSGRWPRSVVAYPRRLDRGGAPVLLSPSRAVRFHEDESRLRSAAETAEPQVVSRARNRPRDADGAAPAPVGGRAPQRVRPFLDAVMPVRAVVAPRPPAQPDPALPAGTPSSPPTPLAAPASAAPPEPAYDRTPTTGPDPARSWSVASAHPIAEQRPARRRWWAFGRRR